MKIAKALLPLICFTAACGGSSSPAAPSPAAAPARGAITVSVTPNPVPFSGQPGAPSCKGNLNTWFYDQTIQSTGGVAVTVLHHVNAIDGTVVNEFDHSYVIAPGGSFHYGTTDWCLSNPGDHTVQTTWTGVDASGSTFTYAGPAVQLQARR